MDARKPDPYTIYTWPAVCQKCGTVQPTFRAGFSPGSGVTFTATIPIAMEMKDPCACGGRRVMLPGELRITDEKIEVVRGPFTAASVTLLSKVLQSLSEGGRPMTIRRSTVEKLLLQHPDLAALLEFLGPPMHKGSGQSPVGFFR